MAGQSSTKLFRKLSKIEQELQSLKVDMYFSLPKTKSSSTKYSQKEILKSLRSNRKRIWKDRYAKNI